LCTGHGMRRNSDRELIGYACRKYRRGDHEDRCGDREVE
jgi:hypothetical protein